MASHAFKNFHAHACIGAAVTNCANVQSEDLALFVAANFVGHIDGMALGVHEKTLFSRERALHRHFQEPGCQRGVSLVAHVFLASKGAAIGDEFYGDLFI